MNGHASELRNTQNESESFWYRILAHTANLHLPLLPPSLIKEREKYMKRESGEKKDSFVPSSQSQKTLNAYLLFLDPNAKPSIILLSPSLPPWLQHHTLHIQEEKRQTKEKESQSEREH